MRSLMLIAILAVGGCSGEPKSFAEADPAITQVDASGEYLNLRIEKAQRVAESTVVQEVGMIVAKAAKALRDGVPGPTAETKFVSFDVRFGDPQAPDRFGSVVFPIAALRSAPDDSLVLNLASSYEWGSGSSAEDAAKACAEDSFFVSGFKGFCHLIAGAAARRAGH